MNAYAIIMYVFASMAKQKTKLELTWIGKENRPKLEPRILIEDPETSYHAVQRHSENDIFDNRLIFGKGKAAQASLLDMEGDLMKNDECGVMNDE